jgi:hypothetical protein
MRKFIKDDDIVEVVFGAMYGHVALCKAVRCLLQS